VDRLLKKFATAAQLAPAPVLRKSARKTRLGAIYFGSTSPAMLEALDMLDETGIHLDALRLRAFPFAESVAQFIEEHETVYVVEQNRDAQMRTLLMSELGIAPQRLVPVLHYDGTPITARFIAGAVTRHVHALVVQPHPQRRSLKPPVTT
jgi:2-oxoglutarate ferredoxin oxidoreductase subunit alpha